MCLRCNTLSHSVLANVRFWKSMFYPLNTSFEPRHDKTNKMAVRPAKTQISLGIRPVWSESSLSALRKLGSLATYWAHSEYSDQTGRTESSLGAQSLRLFCHVAAHFIDKPQENHSLHFHFVIVRLAIFSWMCCSTLTNVRYIISEYVLALLVCKPKQFTCQ